MSRVPKDGLGQPLADPNVEVPANYDPKGAAFVGPNAYTKAGPTQDPGVTEKPQEVTPPVNQEIPGAATPGGGAATLDE